MIYPFDPLTMQLQNLCINAITYINVYMTLLNLKVGKLSCEFECMYVYKNLQEPYGKMVKTRQLMVLLHKRKRLYCQIKSTQSNGLIKFLLKTFLCCRYFISFNSYLTFIYSVIFSPKYENDDCKRQE